MTLFVEEGSATGSRGKVGEARMRRRVTSIEERSAAACSWYSGVEGSAVDLDIGTDLDAVEQK